MSISVAAVTETFPETSKAGALNSFNLFKVNSLLSLCVAKLVNSAAVASPLTVDCNAVTWLWR